MVIEKKWAELTPDEKQEAMFERWLAPQGIEFVSPEAERLYKQRATRIKDAIQLKKLPDRIPVIALSGFFPAKYCGLTTREVMYDYNKLLEAWKKYVFDFAPDAHIGAVAPCPGIIFDILDYKLYSWPGHGVANNHSYQCLEGEYMMADEYDQLIQDPTDFFLRVYFPRIFGALEPFKQLSPFINILEIVFVPGNLVPLGMPNVQEAFKKFLEAGSEAIKWAGIMASFKKQMTENGYPAMFAGATKAPFDVIGDTLRGTKGIILDMYRQPDKVLAAVEAMIPFMIRMGVNAAKMGGGPLVNIPLHKGADGFLSDEQFKKFYWPSFRKVLMGLINEGCVPFCFAEGGYNSRLEVISDLPKGKVMWSFDLTDMAKAKKILGNTACICGNMPVALLNVGTKQQITDYARKIIDVAGKGGGYIMVNGAVIDEAKPENVRAMFDFTKEYGIYGKA